MSGEKLNNKFHWGFALILVTIFQVLTGTVVITANGFNSTLFAIFAGYILLEWAYFIIASIFCGQNNFELEIIGFLFSGIGLTNVATVDNDYALKQIVAIALGLILFIFMLAVMRRTDIVMKLRMPVAFAAVGLLVANLALAKYTNGALNWITIGGISIQPSEFVKLAFIFVGAASLDKLQSARSLTKYLIFSFGCVGALFLMKDFGTALIFFFTFIVIAFMRSGDVRTIALVCVAALLGAIMIVYFKPHVAARFKAYRHIWELINDEGMQQTRTLIYSASGGLFGLGIGNAEKCCFRLDRPCIRNDMRGMGHDSRSDYSYHICFYSSLCNQGCEKHPLGFLCNHSLRGGRTFAVPDKPEYFRRNGYTSVYGSYSSVHQPRRIQRYFLMGHACADKIGRYQNLPKAFQDYTPRSSALSAQYNDRQEVQAKGICSAGC